MKKKYFFAVLFTFFLATLHAQIYDDMESYAGGPICDAPLWPDCGQGAGSLLSSTTQAHSGEYSGYIDGGGVIDGLLILGNKTSGNWYLEFWAYVPSGKMGYFNVQAGVPVIPSWCGEFYLNRDGTTNGAGEVLGQYETTFSFPQDEWFLIEFHWDITNGLPSATWDMHVDEVNVVPPGTPYLDTNGDTPAGLGAIDFFSAHADCELYVDDFGYDDEPLPFTGQDDMESYTVGEPIDQRWWTDAGCGGGIGCSIMSSSDVANSGVQSGLIPDDGTTDAVLNLGNKIFGLWDLSYQMYVPSNKEAFFTVSGDVPVGGSVDVGNFNFNEGNQSAGTGILSNIVLPDVSFNFPHDEWFNVEIIFELFGLNGPTWQVIIDDVELVPAGTVFRDGQGDFPNSLGGMRFTSTSSDSTFYLDDINFCPDSCNLSVENETTSINIVAYPNPVANLLTLQAKESIRSISIYNALGQLMYSEELNALTTQIDMANYQAGMYFVSISNNNASQVINIIKN